jgi:hypothetical protein
MLGPDRRSLAWRILLPIWWSVIWRYFCAAWSLEFAVKLILKHIGSYPETVEANLLLDFLAFLPASIISLKRALELYLAAL